MRLKATDTAGRDDYPSTPPFLITPSFLKTFLHVLDIVEQGVPHSSVLITTSAIPKFYSNGFNLDLARATPGFPRDAWNKLQLRLLTFPMPLVALMNGHAVSVPTRFTEAEKADNLFDSLPLAL